MMEIFKSKGNSMYRYRQLRFIALFFILTSIILSHSIAAAQVVEDQLKIYWAFGALIGEQNQQQLISIGRKAVLHTGDRIKILFEPQTECFIYLFYYSSQAELAILFPTDPSSARILPGIKYSIPAKNQWFKLDDITGIEKFYLIASVRKLEKLEALHQKHSTLTQADDIQASTRAILAEIKQLKRKHRKLTAAAERPVRLGGNFRGAHQDEQPDQPDISQIAVEISAVNFFSRTFTIDHQ
jgi:hypothetical protein